MNQKKALTEPGGPGRFAGTVFHQGDSSAHTCAPGGKPPRRGPCFHCRGWSGLNWSRCTCVQRREGLPMTGGQARYGPAWSMGPPGDHPDRRQLGDRPVETGGSPGTMPRDFIGNSLMSYGIVLSMDSQVCRSTPWAWASSMIRITTGSFPAYRACAAISARCSNSSVRSWRMMSSSNRFR